MRRTLFTMGFQSPVQEYGAVQPGMGISMQDVKDFFKGVSTPTPTAPVVVPAAPTTILGMDQNTVMIGGAILLGLGLVIAIVAGRKAAQPTTAPARK